MKNQSLPASWLPACLIAIVALPVTMLLYYLTSSEWPDPLGLLIVILLFLGIAAFLLGSLVVIALMLADRDVAADSRALPLGAVLSCEWVGLALLVLYRRPTGSFYGLSPFIAAASLLTAATITLTLLVRRRRIEAQ